MKTRVERSIGAGTLSLEAGDLAKQAAGSCLIQYGDTVVLSATATGAPRAGIDFFPLTCDYRERTAAAGKFPGGFLKREGRPTMKEILTARLMDRPIRPLFPSWFKDEVQIQCFVMAHDRQNDADVLAITAAATSLGLSAMPFQGPLAAVRLGRVDGKFVPFPTQDDLEESDLDLIVAGNLESVLMIEGFARQMPEDLMADAVMEAHNVVKQICELQLELIEKIGAEKISREIPESDGLLDQLSEKYYDRFKQAQQTTGKAARDEACSELKGQAVAELIPDPDAEGAIDPAALKSAWHDLEARVIRELILSGTRCDGRDHNTVRPVECAVDLLPRVHGSALFQRGETQALITVALGTGRDEQRVDGLLEEYFKKFMLDYYFPPFSVGEV
ncbi:MAG: polyribonucleotide nucleotidyltransferase, partial [Planctomycetes bacterium]|nr:polyribonucleotide nucleotidyltransferase [Planctomycetota bacterium]